MCFRFALVALALLIGGNIATAEDDASNNPNIKAAQAELDSNPTAAAADYEAAVAADPKLADAHYELGLIYAEKLAEPISSIYHLEHFLKLAPNSEHAPNARQIITQESEAFAASLPNASPTAAQVIKLQAENAALKKQAADATSTITALQTQLAQAGAPRPTPSDAPSPAPSPAPSAIVPGSAAAPPPVTTATVATPAAPGTTAVDASGNRTYTIVKGDSLWKIAHKMYPHDTKNGVDKIQEANKDAIGGKPLKIGQVLVIPQ